MGWGDEIMATAEALTLPGPVAILDRHSKRRWHPAWENNPHIARPEEPAKSELVNGPNARPYIKKYIEPKKRWEYIPDIIPNLPKPMLYLTDQEKALGRKVAQDGPFIAIEPNVNPLNSQNKDWGFDRYQAVVDALDFRIVQMIYPGARVLDGVEVVTAKDMREACGVLESSVGYFGIEGGLHHSAAALDIPAVVLYTGMVHPRVTGYPWHRNISGDGWCGNMDHCEHCRAVAASITVEGVTTAVREMIDDEH